MTKRVPTKEPLREQLRGWGHRLSGGPGAIPVVVETQDRKIGKAAAWSVLLGLYILFFGRGTYTALSILLSGEVVQASEVSLQRNLDYALFSITRVVLIVVVVLFVVRGLGISNRRAGLVKPWSRERTKLEFKIGCLAELFTVGGFVVTTGLAALLAHPTPAYPTGDLYLNLNWLSELASSFAAGPIEELLLVVILVWLLRAAGYSWTVVCVAAVTLRVLFHLYYGWPALGLALWPLMVIYLYKNSGAIIGIIIAHSAFDLFGTLGMMAEQGGLSGLSSVLLYLKIAPAMIGLVYLWRTSEDRSGSPLPQ